MNEPHTHGGTDAPECTTCSTQRHPSTIHMLTMLRPNPNLPVGPPAVISNEIWHYAKRLVLNLPDSPELTAGLRKLLEAKDCFVRASLDMAPVDYRDR